MRRNIYVHRIYVFVLEHTGGHNEQEKQDDHRLHLTWRLHYLVSTGIYARFRNLQKMIFFFSKWLLLHSWEQGAWHPVYLYTKDTSMQFTFAPQVIVWYMSIYNQLFMLVVGASA